MGAVSFIRDRLTNVMSGMGTSVDRARHSFYRLELITPEQVEAAYRSSWLVRKIIDVPPLDMTRAWRDWQAEANDIQALEAEESRLQLKAKCKRALTLARLYGGGAIILGTGDQDPTQPLNVDTVKKGGLLYTHVMSRHQLSVGEAITDPTSEWFGKPSYFEIRNMGGASVKMHPSRVVEFIGQRTPEGSIVGLGGDWFWGDPIMQSIGDAVNNANTAQAGFAALIDEAKIDVLRMKDLMSLTATDDGDKKLMRRLEAAQMGKSTYRALVLDTEDEWDQKQVTFSGIPEMLDAYLLIVAGAADIPMTRLLGQSPKGLQSNGDGEERDYQSMIAARQDEQLHPALERIDELLIRSALDSRPSDIYSTFAPLSQLSEKDAAAIELTFAQVAQIYATTGDVPSPALAAMVRNGIIERGQFPGAEAAFEEADLNPEPEPDPNEPDPSVLVATDPPTNPAKPAKALPKPKA